MAESAEHQFLSKTFLGILDEFSSLGLYSYTEAERKKFDFACTIYRDWNRPLIGQTLWSHPEGIYKDISTMITEEDADIWAYIMRDNCNNRAQLDNVVGNFRNSRYHDQLHRLKILRVPADFDADSEDARKVVNKCLRDSIADDILFNVVFGNLTTRDIRFFIEPVSSIQTAGLEFALLQYVATNGFSSYDAAARALKVSYSTIRERVTRLSAIGFIDGVGRYNVNYYASLKGRVFLDLVRQIFHQAALPVMSNELLYILSKLGLEPVYIEIESDDAVRPLLTASLGSAWTPRSMYATLIFRIVGAMRNFDVDIERADYQIRNVTSQAGQV